MGFFFKVGDPRPPTPWDVAPCQVADVAINVLASGSEAIPDDSGGSGDGFGGSGGGFGGSEDGFGGSGDGADSAVDGEEEVEKDEEADEEEPASARSDVQRVASFGDFEHIHPFLP